MAKAGEYPAVIDRAAALLGWRFEDHERHWTTRTMGGVAAPDGGEG